jgi:hypothetical protein
MLAAHNKPFLSPLLFESCVFPKMSMLALKDSPRRNAPAAASI